MTIDEAIKYYSNKNVVLTEEEAEANTIALNTMCKYVQIKQIFDMWNDFRYEDDDVLAKTSDIIYKGDESNDSNLQRNGTDNI